MGDYSGEIVSEVLAQRQPAISTYSLPVISTSSTSSFKHQQSVVLKECNVNKKSALTRRPKRKYEKKPKVLPSSSQQMDLTALPVLNARNLNQYDFPSSDEDHLSQALSGSSETEEENDPDGPFAFRRKAGCQYYAPHLDQTGNWPWCSPEHGGIGDIRYRYCLTTLTIPQSCVGFARRRIGRGGRILLDRAHSDCSSAFHEIDSETLCSKHHSQNNQFDNTSEANTSDICFSKDLSQMLVNIKTSRWRHFRPRTPSHPDSDSNEFSFKKLYRYINRASMSQPGTQTCNTSTRKTTSAHIPITVEKYQQHLLQLAIMQKHQLAQTHQQQANCITSANQSQSFVSRTLDSASAQFAASALLSSEQLTTLKMKEDVVLGIGINGVLQASGLYKNFHLSGSSAAALVHTNQSLLTSAASALLQSSNVDQMSSPRITSSYQITSSNTATTQVLIGNNIRLTVPSSVATVNSINTLGARHMPRTISSVKSSALKLSVATNCQPSKIPASSSLDTVQRVPSSLGKDVEYVNLCNTITLEIYCFRVSQESEKAALNSIADNTVAMEVT